MTNHLIPDASERKLAEQEYMRHAFDYNKQPIGSRDWCLFWDGWRAARAAAQVGAKGVGVRLPDALEEIISGCLSSLSVAAKKMDEIKYLTVASMLRHIHDELLAASRSDEADLRKALAAGAPAETPKPFGYVLQTGHGNKFSKSLDGVHTDFRNYWKPVYEAPAATIGAGEGKDAALREALREALKSAELGRGSYGINYDGNKLAAAIDAAMRSKTSPGEAG